MSNNGVAENVDRIAEMDSQDVPKAGVGETEPPRTLAELVRIANEEADFQSSVRGPITVPEWGGFQVWYRRLDSTSNSEAAKLYLEHERNDWALFAYRALDANGRRLFPKEIKMYTDELKHWNQSVITRVVNEMARGSETQLSDKDLGK